MSKALSIALAQRQLQAGQLAEAESTCRAILAVHPRDPQALHLLGVIALRNGQLSAAIDAFERSLGEKPTSQAWNNLGETFRRSGELERAIAAFEEALALRADYPQALNNLALTHGAQSHWQEAAKAAQRAVQLDPNYAKAWMTLGSALAAQKKWSEAIAAFERAVHLTPASTAPLHMIATLLEQQGDDKAAADTYQRILQLDPRDGVALCRLGECLTELRQFDQAEAAYRQAAKLRPDDPRALFDLASLLDFRGHSAEAEEMFRRIEHLGVRDAPALTLATRLPHIYESMDDLRRRRDRLQENIARLLDEKFTLSIDTNLAAPLFLLAYQGLPDRDIQRDYARLIAPPPPVRLSPRTRTRDRIRVGFISTNFWAHTIARLNKGTIARLDRSRFEVAVLFAGWRDDEEARFIRQHADISVNLPRSLPEARRVIADLGLDVLFYTDVGMDAQTYTLAFSGLAPVQCVTWGHPSTTGIETIDYFVSSEQLESEQGQQHYTERLVKLPNLAVYYDRPASAPANPDRHAFGLEDEHHVYGCLQSLFKFHPEFDPLLDEILRRDPRGVIVLLRGTSRSWDEALARRLARTMPRTFDRVRWIDQLPRDGFLALTAACDLMLDPIHFGGGNTSYEALAFGVPVVTLPSKMLRGRITYALCHAMGVMDSVARTPQEYVEIALKLGTQREFRRHVADQIRTANHVLYENDAGVRDLERFFIDVSRGQK